MSRSYESTSAAVWWAQPLPVICLMVVLIVFIEKFDWRGFMGTDSGRSSGPVIASGTLYSVTYDLGGGKVGGLTRGSSIDTGVNGEWNLDLHATLTKDALIVQRLKRYDGGKKPVYDAANPQIIPYDRIYEVRFGERGIPLPKQELAHDHSH